MTPQELLNVYRLAYKQASEDILNEMAAKEAGLLKDSLEWASNKAGRAVRGVADWGRDKLQAVKDIRDGVRAWRNEPQSINESNQRNLARIQAEMQGKLKDANGKGLSREDQLKLHNAIRQTAQWQGKTLQPGQRTGWLQDNLGGREMSGLAHDRVAPRSRWAAFKHFGGAALRGGWNGLRNGISNGVNGAVNAIGNAYNDVRSANYKGSYNNGYNGR